MICILEIFAKNLTLFLCVSKKKEKQSSSIQKKFNFIEKLRIWLNLKLKSNRLINQF